MFHYMISELFANIRFMQNTQQILQQVKVTIRAVCSADSDLFRVSHQLDKDHLYRHRITFPGQF